MSAQLELPWDLAEMEMAERTARIEAEVGYLRETVDRNRTESKQERNQLSTSMEDLHKKIEAIDKRLDTLFSILDQAKGAKKLALSILAVLGFFGLAGLYQVSIWIQSFMVGPKH